MEEMSAFFTRRVEFHDQIRGHRLASLRDNHSALILLFKQLFQQEYKPHGKIIILSCYMHWQV